MLCACTKCGKEIPQQNIMLHELRCPGNVDQPISRRNRRSGSTPSLRARETLDEVRAEQNAYVRRNIMAVRRAPPAAQEAPARSPETPEQQNSSVQTRSSNRQIANASSVQEAIVRSPESPEQHTSSVQTRSSNRQTANVLSVQEAEGAGEGEEVYVIIADSSQLSLSQEICDMVNQFVGYGRVSENEVMERLKAGDDGADANRVLHLAFRGTTLIGCASSTKAYWAAEAGCGHWGLLVEKGASHFSNVATALIEAAEQRLSAMGCNEIQIEYHVTPGTDDEQRLISWYERTHGFRCISGRGTAYRTCRKRLADRSPQTSAADGPSAPASRNPLLRRRESITSNHSSEGSLVDEQARREEQTRRRGSGSSEGPTVEESARRRSGLQHPQPQPTGSTPSETQAVEEPQRRRSALIQRLMAEFQASNEPLLSLDLESSDHGGGSLQRSNSAEALPSPPPPVEMEDSNDERDTETPTVIIGDSGNLLQAQLICDMVNDGFGYNRLTRSDVIDRLRKGDDRTRANRVLHLAFRGGVVVGCASSTKQPSWCEQGCGHWGLLVVDRMSRSTGVASALVAVAEQRLATAGCREIQIEYDYVRGNPDSQRLKDWYEGECGFHCVSGAYSTFRKCRKLILVQRQAAPQHARPSAQSRIAARPLDPHIHRTISDQTSSQTARTRQQGQAHSTVLARASASRAGNAGSPIQSPSTDSSSPSQASPTQRFDPAPRSERFGRAQHLRRNALTPPPRMAAFRSEPRSEPRVEPREPRRANPELSCHQPSSASSAQAQPNTRQVLTNVEYEMFVKTLPVHKVTDQDIWDMDADDAECTICLMEYQAGDEQVTLCCFHRFHHDCAKQWLSRSRKCPLCKSPQDLRTCPSTQVADLQRKLR